MTRIFQLSIMIAALSKARMVLWRYSGLVLNARIPTVRLKKAVESLYKIESQDSKLSVLSCITRLFN